MAGRRYAPPTFGGRVDVAVEVGERSAAEGSGCSKPDRRRDGLGVRRRLMFVIFLLDPVLRNRWILQLVKAFGLGVLPSPGIGVDGDFFAGVRAGGGRGRRCEDEDVDVSLQFHLLYPFLMLLYFFAVVRCILSTFC